MQSPFAPAQDLIPEGILLLGAVVCWAAGAVRPTVRLRTLQAISAVTLLAAAVSCLFYLRNLPVGGYTAYSDGLIVDRFALFTIPTLCAFALFTVLAGDAVAERIRPHAGEYHGLVLMATLGGALLVSAREMIAFYVALELLSVSLYVLVGMAKTDPRGSEAGFKYLIFGAASSAVLLYGLALLYGLTGTTVLTEVAQHLGHTTAASALGIALVLVGLSFKLGAVPFHQWVPDVYEGAPAPIAGLIATLSKTAGFAAVARLAVVTFGVSASTWTAVIAALAVASMVYGNVVALAQTRMRRLLAYSSIGQAGFVLMGLLAWRSDQQGVGAALFYLFTYGITLVGAFAAVALVEAAGVGDNIDDYRGLSRRAPAAAAVLALAMVSLVGIPPLVGFFAKLFVFEAAVLAGYAWLLVIAVASTVISAGYYLRVLKVMFVDAPQGEEPTELPPADIPVRVAVVVCALATVALGAAAQPLLALAVGGSGQLIR